VRLGGWAATKRCFPIQLAAPGWKQAAAGLAQCSSPFTLHSAATRPTDDRPSTSAARGLRLEVIVEPPPGGPLLALTRLNGQSPRASDCYGASGHALAAAKAP